MQVNDRILGIDPGSNIMGYGLIHVKDKHPSLIKMVVLKLNKNDSQLLRMKHIFHFTLQLIEEYCPILWR